MSHASNSRRSSGQRRKALARASGSALRVFPCDKTFTFIAPPCPYCGGKLSARATAWEEHEHGWIATELDIDCDQEPDIDSEDWESWWDSHSFDNCDGWHLVYERMIAYLKTRVRFDIQNSGDGPPKE